MSIAYFNGEFLPLDAVRISPLDRGYLFADGVYEVIPVYGGRLFRIGEHLERLQRSLEAVRIENPMATSAWVGTLEALVAQNFDPDQAGVDQALYLQVTRGEAPRNHAFPVRAQPSVFAMTRSATPVDRSDGAAAVTRDDFRWSRCHIKSIALLPNVLLRQEASEVGAAEAILLREGRVTEGAATNVFVVRDGRLATPAKDQWILAGITRDVVLELAGEERIACEERVVLESELRGADEIWITSSTMEVTPVVRLDANPVGHGSPGPVWQRIHARFQSFKRELAKGGVAA